MTKDTNFDKLSNLEKHITESPVENPCWRNEFSERELQEIDFCIKYAREYNHGTDGHLIRNIVAKLVETLDAEG